MGLYCYVSGSVEDIRKVGNDLLNAADTAEFVIMADGDGTDVEIQYKDKKITISYKPSGIRSGDETEEETKTEEDVHEIDMDELEKMCSNKSGADWFGDI